MLLYVSSEEYERCSGDKVPHLVGHFKASLACVRATSCVVTSLLKANVCSLKAINYKLRYPTVTLLAQALAKGF